ncbi:nuclear transport factor 2 family protein [Rhizobium sp. KVB221]|uniref:Nuclear transport factor 2 family protein n=1 Tax=Rhizobium setariae TaxID=2801340 RepID=A0A936YVP1_9HYPH|nr:nuclear transport factor 2 family protein [Rhizobium setariae]
MSIAQSEFIRAEEALKATEDYVLGVAVQDQDKLTKLFAETAHIVGIDEGVSICVPRDRWINAICTPERAGTGSPNYEVVSLNLAGNVAVVIVRTSYGRFDYTDVLTLLKHEDETRITQKCFHQRERTNSG